jgi:hypothetical protein
MKKNVLISFITEADTDLNAIFNFYTKIFRRCRACRDLCVFNHTTILSVVSQCDITHKTKCPNYGITGQ